MTLTFLDLLAILAVVLLGNALYDAYYMKLRYFYNRLRDETYSRLRRKNTYF